MFLRCAVLLSLFFCSSCALHRSAAQKTSSLLTASLSIQDSIDQNYVNEIFHLASDHLEQGVKLSLRWKVNAESSDIGVVLSTRSFRQAGESVAGIASGIATVGIASQPKAFVSITGDKERDTWVLVHEIGHLLGAKHSTKGVMAKHEPSRQWWGYPELRFSSESLHQVRAYLENRTTTFPNSCQAFLSPHFVEKG